MWLRRRSITIFSVFIPKIKSMTIFLLFNSKIISILNILQDLKIYSNIVIYLIFLYWIINMNTRWFFSSPIKTLKSISNFNVFDQDFKLKTVNSNNAYQTHYRNGVLFLIYTKGQMIYVEQFSENCPTILIELLDERIYKSKTLICR